MVCRSARSAIACLIESEVGASADAGELAQRSIPLPFLAVLTDGKRVITYGRFRRLRKELEL